MTSFRKLWFHLIRKYILRKVEQHNSQEWFDGEISEVIKNHDYRKLLKTLKNLHYMSVWNYTMQINMR